MGAKTFQELAAWQLAAELRDQVIAAIEKPPLCHHRKLCDQLERAVEHAPGDIAEGFGRYYPREFARYLGIARSELMEAQNHLDAPLGVAPWRLRCSSDAGRFHAAHWALRRVSCSQCFNAATRRAGLRTAGAEHAAGRRTMTPRDDSMGRISSEHPAQSTGSRTLYRAPCPLALAPSRSASSKRRPSTWSEHDATRHRTEHPVLGTMAWSSTALAQRLFC
jgi:hypothetical protein